MGGQKETFRIVNKRSRSYVPRPRRRLRRALFFRGLHGSLSPFDPPRHQNEATISGSTPFGGRSADTVRRFPFDRSSLSSSLDSPSTVCPNGTPHVGVLARDIYNIFTSDIYTGSAGGEQMQRQLFGSRFLRVQFPSSDNCPDDSLHTRRIVLRFVGLLQTGLVPVLATEQKTNSLSFVYTFY